MVGVLVKAGCGVKVCVAGAGGSPGVELGAPCEAGVTLNKAWTVCAAAVPAGSLAFPEGRLHAPINKVMITIRLKRCALFFIFSPSEQKEFYRRLSLGVSYISLINQQKTKQELRKLLLR